MTCGIEPDRPHDRNAQNDQPASGPPRRKHRKKSLHRTRLNPCPLLSYPSSGHAMIALLGVAAARSCCNKFQRLGTRPVLKGIHNSGVIAMTIALALVASLVSSRLRADEPAQRLTGFAQAGWTAREGAPGEFRNMTQTTDGTLWFATDRGLYWFDGIHFFRFEGTAKQRLETGLISTVYAPPTGGLWMGFRLGGGVAFLENGVISVHTPD